MNFNTFMSNAKDSNTVCSRAEAAQENVLFALRTAQTHTHTHTDTDRHTHTHNEKTRKTLSDNVNNTITVNAHTGHKKTIFHDTVTHTHRSHAHTHTHTYTYIHTYTHTHRWHTHNTHTHVRGDFFFA